MTASAWRTCTMCKHFHLASDQSHVVAPCSKCHLIRLHRSFLTQYLTDTNLRRWTGIVSTEVPMHQDLEVTQNRCNGNAGHMATMDGTLHG